MLRIVDRLALIELRAPLLFGIAAFSLLAIATVVMQEAAKFVIKHDLPVGYFLEMVLLASPQFVVYAIPMGVLLGTLLSIGRLSSDLEITALRACGVSMYRVLMPYVLAGVFLSGVTFYGSERVVPFTNSRLKELKNNVIRAQGKKERIVEPIRQHGELRWLLTARESEGTRLEDVKLFYFDPVDEDSDFYVTADRADWIGNSWTFYNMRQVMLRPSEQEHERLVFYYDKFRMPDFAITPKSLALRAKTPEDLTIIQLSTVIRELLDGEYSPGDKEILDFQTQLHFKYAIPLTPLFFVLFALPLGIMRQRSSNMMGFGLALLVVLGYYASYILCLKLGAAGVLPPPLAAWTPNGLLLAVGLVAMQRRERN